MKPGSAPERALRPPEGAFILAVLLAGFLGSGTNVESSCMIAKDDFDPLAPQREAAMFYGLFLRGHSAEALRRDIDIPKPVFDKWLNSNRFEPQFRDNLRRLYSFRKQVLAIFDELVDNERNRARVH